MSRKVIPKIQFILISKIQWNLCQKESKDMIKNLMHKWMNVILSFVQSWVHVTLVPLDLE